ncbi:acyclic terpene utilization AtuA family protein [Prauserella oleivorans]
MSSHHTSRSVSIGGASGAWGDSPLAIGQLLGEDIDYLMMDYLAEVTMSLLARARAKNPEAGYVPDLLAYLKPHLATLAERGIRVVTNGGGLNPLGAQRALQSAIDEAGLKLKVAAVTGDNVLYDIKKLAASDSVRTENGEPVPEGLLTANAYLGALPIRAALDDGASIVITGRCADSALALGVLQHEFGWSADDYHRLAAGSLVGHVLECGPQATGGTFTDWWKVPEWHNIGYPIAHCSPDGSFVLTKPRGTGGLIDSRCVAEQILYEIGDPKAYVLPDVIADFSHVRVRRIDADHVQVSGARGRPPTSSYKVSATLQEGYKSVSTVSIVGPHAAAKAQRTGEEMIKRAERIFAELGLGPYIDTRIEVLGAESAYGSRAANRDVREVVLRLVTTHPLEKALALAAREIGSIGLSFAPGTTGIMGGRPRPTPQLVLRTLYLDKKAAPAVHVVTSEGAKLVREAFSPVPRGSQSWSAPSRSATTTDTAPHVPSDTISEPGVEVPLHRIAHARSGDKGNRANVAIIARRPEFFELLRTQVTPGKMARLFAEQVAGRVQVFEAPGLYAINFLMDDALGGGEFPPPHRPAGQGLCTDGTGAHRNRPRIDDGTAREHGAL